MNFDFVIFATVLYALTTETIEDSFVLIIYQITFGKKNVIYGVVFASAAVASILVLLVLYGIPSIERYSEYVVKGSGLFLVGLGSYWILKFLLVRSGILKEESELNQKSITKSFASFIMAFAELLEILAILVPFILTDHIAETSISIAVSVTISMMLMFAVGGRLRNKFANRLTQVKLFAGMALMLSGSVIIFNLK
ncbi:MAG TPA: hypothetical protein VFV16_08610 [Candidatus Nitrosotalea sp.]|nr:hypothetical protein [Candidatus Nitrosotalea sp.]